MARKRPKTFSEDLRRRILDSDLTLGELSRQSGVPKGVLSRFSRGLTGMSVPSLDAVIEVLDLRLVDPEEYTSR